MEEALVRFREVFWDGFHKPSLYSDSYIKLWESLEPLNEQLSGPLFSVYENGHCDFFFQDKNRFPWMNIPEDFMQWYNDRIEKYKTLVEEQLSLSEKDAHDKEVLLFQVDIKMELADIAYEIQCERLFKDY